jgi:uncharacterized Tic20 family protein
MEAKDFDTTVQDETKFRVTPDEKNWAVFTHLAALAGFAIPFGNIIGPLVVWIMKKEEMPFVDHQGKEALNFQITFSIAMVISLFLMIIVIGIVTSIILVIAWIVVVVRAGLAVSEGKVYRYPFTIRFIS